MADNLSSDEGAAGCAPAHDLHPLLDRVDVCFYAKDEAGRYVFANKALGSLFKLADRSLIGQTDAAFLDAPSLARIRSNDQRVLQAGEIISLEEKVSMADGSTHVFWSIKAPVLDAHRRIVGLCGMSSLIAQTYRGAEGDEPNQLLSLILNNVDAHIYLKDHEGRYLYANPNVLGLFGRGLVEILGRTDGELLAPEIASRVTAIDRQVLASSSRQVAEEILVNHDGSERHFWSIKMPVQVPDHPACLIGFSTDITELLSLRRALEQQRAIDPLSGLANRVQFEFELDFELRHAEREDAPLAVVLLDIDHFKYINAGLGQESGNELIRAMGERLRQGIFGIDSMARLSGNEFAFAIPGFASTEELAAQVEHIRALLSQSYRLAGKLFHLTISAGVSVYPADGHTAAALLSCAESALYYAKECGRDQCRFYSRELGEAAAARIEMERDLRAALAAGEFELYYQPKIRRVDGRIAGMEALLRWNRKGAGLVEPARFIPLAEQLGLLIPIGKWVIEESCRQIAQWRQMGLGNIAVAVNLSPSQLASQSLLPHLAQTLRQHEIDPDCFEMELTESMMMRDPGQVIGILKALRALGVHLSIDDFGTGYSSMAYLRDLPVDMLKLDRSFIMQIDTNSRDADLCAGIIALAHTLGLEVVAEGVETETQRSALAQRQCDIYQGYLLSRPLPAAVATRYLREMRG